MRLANRERVCKPLEKTCVSVRRKEIHRSEVEILTAIQIERICWQFIFNFYFFVIFR